MKLTAVSLEEFDDIYNRIERAFPYEERRDKDDEKKLFDKENFRFCRLVSDEETVGVAAYWLFDDFLFLEHLAINKEQRGKGRGTEFLREIKNFGVPVVLEVEKPTYDYAVKRIAFYERGGFVLNEKNDYEQPSYHGGDGVPLLIMSSSPLSVKETEEVTARIYETCYGIKKN